MFDWGKILTIMLVAIGCFLAMIVFSGESLAKRKVQYLPPASHFGYSNSANNFYNSNSERHDSDSYYRKSNHYNKNSCKHNNEGLVNNSYKYDNDYYPYYVNQANGFKNRNGSPYNYGYYSNSYPNGYYPVNYQAVYYSGSYPNGYCPCYYYNNGVGVPPGLNSSGVKPNPYFNRNRSNPYFSR